LQHNTQQGLTYSLSLPQDSLAERSKAVAEGAIPQGRGFEPHSCHHFAPAQPQANSPRASVQSTTSLQAMLTQEELVGIYSEMLVRMVDRRIIATILRNGACSVVVT